MTGRERMHFGPVVRCRNDRHRGRGCEAGWPDCVRELWPYEPPTWSWCEEPTERREIERG